MKNHLNPAKQKRKRRYKKTVQKCFLRRLFLLKTSFPPVFRRPLFSSGWSTERSLQNSGHRHRRNHLRRFSLIFFFGFAYRHPDPTFVVGTLHIAVGVNFQHSISVSPIFCPSFGYHSFQTWVFRLCRVPDRGSFAENIAHSLSGKVWNFSPSGSCIHFLRACLFTVPCSYCVYSPFRAITKALANMAITKETVPAAAMVRATIPLQRVFFPTAGCTGW